MTGAQAVPNAPVSTALLPNIFLPKRKLPSMVPSRAAIVPYRFKGGKGNGPREKYYGVLILLSNTFALILKTLSEKQTAGNNSVLMRRIECLPSCLFLNQSYLNHTCLQTQYRQSAPLKLLNYVRINTAP